MQSSGTKSSGLESSAKFTVRDRILERQLWDELGDCQSKYWGQEGDLAAAYFVERRTVSGTSIAEQFKKASCLRRDSDHSVPQSGIQHLSGF